MLTRDAFVIVGLPEALVLGGCWGLAMMETTNRSWRDWKPLFAVTPARVTLARALLITLGVAFVTTAVLSLKTRLQGGVPTDRTLMWLFSSLLALNGSYIAMHWAFRPANIFGTHQDWFLDPLGTTVRRLFRTSNVNRNGRDED